MGRLPSLELLAAGPPMPDAGVDQRLCVRIPDVHYAPTVNPLN